MSPPASSGMSPPRSSSPRAWASSRPSRCRHRTGRRCDTRSPSRAATSCRLRHHQAWTNTATTYAVGWRRTMIDIAGIDDLLSDEEKAIRASVRRLCDDLIDPYVAEWFERGELGDVRGLAKELGSLGLLGMHLEGYGCAGMSATAYGLACLELEASDSG